MPDFPMGMKKQHRFLSLILASMMLGGIASQLKSPTVNLSTVLARSKKLLSRSIDNTTEEFEKGKADVGKAKNG